MNLAIDTEGSFWRENLRDYCAHGNWPLNGVQQITVYDGRKDKMWKDSAQIDRFRQKYKGGVKTLSFEEFDEEETGEVDEEQKTKNTKDVVKYLELAFLRIEGKQEATVKEGELPNPQTPLRVPRYLDDCEKTFPEEFQRPKLTTMKLVASPKLYGE